VAKNIEMDKSISGKSMAIGLLIITIAGLGLLDSSTAAITKNNIQAVAQQDQVTTTTFSEKGTIIPLTVINPRTGEYTLAGTWTMDVNEGKVTNFTAEMQVEGHPVTHQLMNFRQAADEEFELDADNSGEIRGTADMMHDNNIAHRNVSTNITIDRGVVMSVTLDIVDLGYPINPTIYGLTES
jgi:hypothetical protein